MAQCPGMWHTDRAEGPLLASLRQPTPLLAPSTHSKHHRLHGTRRSPVGLMARFLRPLDSSLLQAVSRSAMSGVMPALACAERGRAGMTQTELCER